MQQSTTQSYVELVLLSAIWGSSFLFLRIAAPEFGPLFLVQMRVLSAVLVMLPMCILMGKWPDLVANWRMIFLISLTNMAVPFCFFAFAALYVSAGLLSIMNATVPFFTALIAFFVFGQRLAMLSILGMAVGFAGVIVLVFDPQAIGMGAGSALAVPAVLLACFLYGIALNLVAHKLAGVSGLAITAGSLLFSSLLLLPFSLQAIPETMPAAPVWAAVAALGIGCTGLAYLMFYRLISRIGTQQTIMTTYLIPLFSILWGNLFLAESITLFTVMGCMLVLLGVGMTTGRLPGLNKLIPQTRAADKLKGQK